ncbi:RCC1/BLIP-II protein [Moesziomyces antarcticus]|uniref:Related to SAF1 - protein involved in proteasome-dependent degradation n=2 Tax=Pseudozyma antarctica TaxID=84753 RepID=A0A5C3FWT0_PSEA2|nr:RCC1/BLIP-II protein [Moesziomyces antarcticus]GAK67208.1 RCC1/BLIP-II protein [Moesziomyces antarcticus]SPO48185.1 related to SAF1 - protein involved in proteasome-dependent degradation [Moesziomyces antarcticus]
MNPLELPLPVVVDNLLPLLSNADLAALRSVSKHAKALVEDEVLWKRKVLADFTFPQHATARMGGWFNLYRGLSNPHVYVWGQLSQGRLGLDLDQLDSKIVLDANSIHGGIPYPVRLTAIGSASTQRTLADDAGAVVEIVAGGWAFHARTSTGKVWHWGTMHGETFAGPRSSLRDPGSKVDTPQLMHGLPDVQSLSGGRCHAVALSTDHELLEWRAWGSIWKLQNLPESITTPSPAAQHDGLTAKSNIRQLEAGWSFSAVLTYTSEVWLWYSDWNADEFQRSYYDGHERESMLHADPPGYGDQKVFPLQVEPVCLPRIAGEGDAQHIVQIAAGEDFIVALTASGTLHRIDLHLPPPTGNEWQAIRQAYALRRDDDGLGGVVHRQRINRLFATTARWEALAGFERPEALQDFDPTWLAGGVAGRITHISAHFRRFVVIIPVIHGEREDTLVLLGTPDSVQPEMVPELQARGVIKVVMGDYHYGALTQQGEILTWGAFSKGALGNWPPPWHLASSTSDRTEAEQEGGGWLGNLVPLPRVLRPSRVPRQTPRAGHQDVHDPTQITIHPRGGAMPFAFDLAFAGWHSSALAMPAPP